MKLNPKRFYYLLLVTVGLAIVLLLAGAYVGNSLLKTKSKDVASNRKKSMVLEEKQRQLNKAKADIKKYQDLAAIAKDIVPQDKDQAQTIREVVNIASANGIKLGTITFPVSSLGDNKIPHSQLKKVASIPGVYSLDITVQSDSKTPPSFTNFSRFLEGLEHNRRTALVSGISLQPEKGDPSKLSFTLTLSEYIKP